MSANALELRLPYPPSTNTYWRHVGPKVLISAAGRKYRETVQTLLRFTHSQAPQGELCVEIDVYPPDRRRRDLDNVLKALLDACTAAEVWEDDSLVSRLVVNRMGVVKGGWVVLHVSSLKEDR